MTFWNLVALATFNLCRGDNNIMVPLYHDEVTGSPAVAVTVRGLGEVQHATCALTFARTSVFRFDVDLTSTIIFETNTSYVEPNARFHTEEAISKSSLTIGPRSTMLEMFNPIAVIKNSSDPVSLILNTTDEFFYNHCIAESLVAARYTNAGTGIRLQGMRGSVAMIDREVSSVGDEVILKLIPENVLMALPLRPYNELMLSILAAGMTRSSHPPMHFTNCHNLPQSLSLQLAIWTTEETWVHLIVYPEDYFEVPGSDVCRLKIVKYRRGAIFVNPLMLPGLNFRIHQYGLLELCDTSI